VSEILVRAARVGELTEVGALTVQAYLADGSITESDAYVTQLRDAAGRARDADLLVAVDGQQAGVGRLLGTVTVCAPGTPWAEVSRPGEVELRMLAVAPDTRGRGVGELLTRAVLDQATARGAHRVVLCSSDYMHVAHRLYARLGFTRLPARDWQPDPNVRLWAFALDLTRE